ncbi:protein SRG1-like [Neltuma alba]|uniref:protein SRG1-like n=1 Tax=Neltuma alba TaxID=207710 RepID=UPI0010A4A14F|nr:protein SRG1-like [Prosopis alba]
MEAEEGNKVMRVPCVKDLAKEALSRVPDRYIHAVDIDPIVCNSPSSPQIPVIDLSNLLSCDHHVKEAEVHKLHLASQQWGFFQVINHGVREDLVEKMKKGVKELFDLPMEEKNKLWQKAGEMEGFGQMFEVSEQQKLNWVDVFYVFTLPSHLRNTRLFPNIPLPFREDLEEYSVEVREVARKILGGMAEALGMKKEEMKESFGEGGQSMRINYYPPCPQPQDVIGINAHTDGTALTVLLQVNDVVGLQIKHDGVWVPVLPLPHSFVVNIGDVLQIITNGAYTSVEHRAIINSKMERISIATFYGPGREGYIGRQRAFWAQKSPRCSRR